jgi:hypothetical protein
MIKFVIAFCKPQNLPNFENAYNDLLAKIEQMPAIQRRQVVSVLGSPAGEPAFYRLLETYFEDVAHMEAALRGAAGQAAGAALGQHFASGTYQAFFAEVYEESGGSTPV